MSFVVVWEFRVRPGQENAFEAVYGDDGEWVKLFRQSTDYLRTEFIRDTQNMRRYLTVDVWKSQAAYEAFRNKSGGAYARIDLQCEGLTEMEREMGRFESVPASEKA